MIHVFKKDKQSNLFITLILEIVLLHVIAFHE